MLDARIAIVGGGLSGLYAALLLERRGIKDTLLLEARDTFGGRIASAFFTGQASVDAGHAAGGIDRFDLGPAWFWPDYQPQLQHLVRDFGLEGFEQFETGDMLVERSLHEPPMRVQGYANSPASVRLVGGMETLIDALRHKLGATRVITGQTVRRLRSTGQCVELDSEGASGGGTTWRVEHVLLALPPRLAEDRIEFSPALPQALARQWRATATWMASHAKFIALYDTPFWREQGLSGEARSTSGPLGEIHDASMPGGSAALFGFFSVPAHARLRVPADVLRTHCRAQLARLFGPQAAMPRAEFIKDWAQDPYTATTADLDATGQHAEPPAAAASSGPWCGRLTGIASEWSPQFPGYLAGAVDAAHRGVAALPSPIQGQEGTRHPCT